MSIICNTRCLNSFLTGAQRYTQSILDSGPFKIQEVSPSVKMSRGMKGHLWEQLVLPALVGNNLLWSPSNSGPIICKRQVVTIHDLVSFDHPEWFNNTYVKWYNFMLPIVCKKADHIITISQFTKQRLIERFKIPESKITMIYNGGNQILPINNGHEATLKIPFKRYILSLGSLEVRKNFAFLLKAWNNILPKTPEDIGLIIVGGKVNEKIFADAGIGEIPKRVHFTGHVPDDQVAQLYANAMTFAYLSTYEGFGLPPLEAMSAGIPVLASNTTAIPEVVSDAGILIDPFSLNECENALIKLIDNEQLRQELSIKAKARAKKFDWADTAAKTYKVLEQFA
jgi:glycosyltransferase involved in cell wall biosynthesis